MKFFSDVKHFIWEDPLLFKVCADQVVLRCVLYSKDWEILRHSHSGAIRGHFCANRTMEKGLASGFFKPSMFQDALDFVNSCNQL